MKSWATGCLAITLPLSLVIRDSLRLSCDLQLSPSSCPEHREGSGAGGGVLHGPGDWDGMGWDGMGWEGKEREGAVIRPGVFDQEHSHPELQFQKARSSCYILPRLYSSLTYAILLSFRYPPPHSSPLAFPALLSLPPFFSSLFQLLTFLLFHLLLLRNTHYMI